MKRPQGSGQRAMISEPMRARRSQYRQVAKPFQAPSPYLPKPYRNFLLLLPAGFVFNPLTVYEPDPSVDNDGFRFARVPHHQIGWRGARDHRAVAVDRP